jgi:hypothetical protein
VLLQKVIRHPFDHFACGIHELHATPITSAIYRWGELFRIKKILFSIFTIQGFFIPMKAYPTTPLFSGQSNLVRLFAILQNKE